MIKINRRVDGNMIFLDSSDGSECLKIHETVENDVGTIAPEGKLTVVMANDIEDEMTSMALLCSKIVIDMKGVSFISNSVLKKVLDVQHIVDSRNGAMIITGVDDSIYGVFEEMGLESVFEIVRDKDC